MTQMNGANLAIAVYWWNDRKNTVMFFGMFCNVVWLITKILHADSADKLWREEISNKVNEIKNVDSVIINE